MLVNLCVSTRNQSLVLGKNSKGSNTLSNLFRPMHFCFLRGICIWGDLPTLAWSLYSYFWMNYLSFLDEPLRLEMQFDFKNEEKLVQRQRI